MEGSGTAPLQPSVCFTVEKIIGVSHGYGNMKTYQVQWSPSWVSSAHLVGCENLLQEFLNQQQQQTSGEAPVVDNDTSAAKKKDSTLINDTSKEGEIANNLDESLLIDIHSCNPATILYPDVSTEGVADGVALALTSVREIKVEPAQDYKDAIKDISSAPQPEPTTSNHSVEFPDDRNNDETAGSSVTEYDTNMIGQMSEYVTKQEQEQEQEPELVLLDGDTDDELDAIEEGMDLQRADCTTQNKKPNRNAMGLNIHVAGVTKGHLQRVLEQEHQRQQQQQQQQQQEYEQHIQQQIQQLYCDICQKPFSCRSFFIRHLRQHTQEKPFQCKHCEKAFTRKFTLKKHLKSAHPDQFDISSAGGPSDPFECQFCGETFATVVDYNEHWKSHQVNVLSSPNSMNFPVSFDNSGHENLLENVVPSTSDVIELT